jgi:hypothetical protein
LLSVFDALDSLVVVVPLSEELDDSVLLAPDSFDDSVLLPPDSLDDEGLLLLDALDANEDFLSAAASVFLLLA